jgi:general stress protein CsbA
MLLGTNFSTVYLEVLALLIIDIVLLIAGFYLFSWMEEKTKKSGTISHH